MSCAQNKNNDGAPIIVFFFIVLAFFGKFPSMPNFASQHNSAASQKLYFHVARFYGAEVKPTKSIIDAEIENAADAFNIPRNIFKALVKVESGGNPKALSSVGARGVAQIMPFNAGRCGLPNPDKLWDAVLNLRCGAQILSEEIEVHGDYHKALTVYNCGRVKCPAGKQYASKVLELSKKIT